MVFPLEKQRMKLGGRNTNVLGTYFGEYSAARDPRFIQLAVKVFF
jgi:hypothetical protein